MIKIHKLGLKICQNVNQIGPTMKKVILILGAIIGMNTAVAGTGDDIIDRYEEACGAKCAETISYLSNYAAQQCGMSYDRVVEMSVELTGLQFVAMANAVGHPLTSALQNYALKSVDCSNLTKWSKSIQEYALVLEANNGLKGSNVGN